MMDAATISPEITSAAWASIWYAGKRVLVTGGTSGIGAGIARGFIEAGADVTVAGVGDAEIAAAASDPVLSKARAHRLDVRDGEATIWTSTQKPYDAAYCVAELLGLPRDKVRAVWTFGTGSYGPIARIVTLLAWANDRDSVDKLTIGNMAKYTLASNAGRDPALLSLLKPAAKNQPKEVAVVLNEVIEAAETMETTRLRKDALASIEDLKRKDFIALAGLDDAEIVATDLQRKVTARFAAATPYMRFLCRALDLQF